MKIEINNALQSKLAAATNELEIAKANQQGIKAAFDKSLEESMAAAGLGKRAMVEHVHAAAHHGNISTNLAVSEVINVYASDRGNVFLRIRLGSATRKDKLTDQYASLQVADVLRITLPSNKSFKE